ncbi:MAG: imidazole glycerol phosphate synthase cyclase subunit [bacterium]|nr:imidazole glycerol phosphate synthase cyclase subunit [bacterium]
MLKKRIVATLIIKNGMVVQSIGFRTYLPVGDPRVSVEFLSAFGIDEIIILDIDATRQNRKLNFALITEISKRIFVPLTVGGGIKTLEDMRKLLHCGADKIAINAAAIKNPHIIKEAALVFGNQCIVVSLDVKANKGGEYEIFSDSGNISTGLEPVSFARKVEQLGAGEILINSIDRDGSKSGYDVPLIKSITAAVKIPVIACGGVGLPNHFLEGFEKGEASASAAGNFFHFTEHSPILVKSYLAQKKVDVRLDTYANYADATLDKKTGRISKRPESYLDKLRFEYLPEEVI